MEGEHEVRRLRAELARVTGESDAHLATLTAVLGELEEVRRTARGQATRIRLGALREAAELSERISEMTKRPGGVRERMLEALTEAIARIGGEARDGVPAWQAPAEGDEPVPAGRPMFAGHIQVDVGPIPDFAKLVIFEDAVRSVAGATEISVTRFSEGRASIELSLAEPVALLHELEERCDLEFVIRDMRPDRLVLDVGD